MVLLYKSQNFTMRPCCHDPVLSRAVLFALPFFFFFFAIRPLPSIVFCASLFFLSFISPLPPSPTHRSQHLFSVHLSLIPRRQSPFHHITSNLLSLLPDNHVDDGIQLHTNLVDNDESSFCTERVPLCLHTSAVCFGTVRSHSP